MDEVRDVDRYLESVKANATYYIEPEFRFPESVVNIHVSPGYDYNWLRARTWTHYYCGDISNTYRYEDSDCDYILRLSTEYKQSGNVSNNPMLGNLIPMIAQGLIPFLPNVALRVRPVEDDYGTLSGVRTKLPIYFSVHKLPKKCIPLFQWDYAKSGEVGKNMVWLKEQLYNIHRSEVFLSHRDVFESVFLCCDPIGVYSMTLHNVSFREPINHTKAFWDEIEKYTKPVANSAITDNQVLEPPYEPIEISAVRENSIETNVCPEVDVRKLLTCRSPVINAGQQGSIVALDKNYVLKTGLGEYRVISKLIENQEKVSPYLMKYYGAFTAKPVNGVAGPHHCVVTGVNAQRDVEFCIMENIGLWTNFWTQSVLSFGTGGPPFTDEEKLCLGLQCACALYLIHEHVEIHGFEWQGNHTIVKEDHPPRNIKVTDNQGNSVTIHLPAMRFVLKIFDFGSARNFNRVLGEKEKFFTTDLWDYMASAITLLSKRGRTRQQTDFDFVVSIVNEVNNWSTDVLDKLKTGLPSQQVTTQAIAELSIRPHSNHRKRPLEYSHDSDPDSDRDSNPETVSKRAIRGIAQHGGEIDSTSPNE